MMRLDATVSEACHVVKFKETKVERCVILYKLGNNYCESLLLSMFKLLKSRNVYLSKRKVKSCLNNKTQKFQPTNKAA